MTHLRKNIITFILILHRLTRLFKQFSKSSLIKQPYKSNNVYTYTEDFNATPLLIPIHLLRGLIAGVNRWIGKTGVYIAVSYKQIHVSQFSIYFLLLEKYAPLHSSSSRPKPIKEVTFNVNPTYIYTQLMSTSQQPNSSFPHFTNTITNYRFASSIIFRQVCELHLG